MEHIVQFGINLDDSAIREYVEKEAMRVAIEQIQEEIKKELCGSEDTYYNYARKIGTYADEMAERFFEKYKQEIIDRAATKLADKLVKTKAVKSMLEEELNKI